MLAHVGLPAGGSSLAGPSGPGPKDPELNGVARYEPTVQEDTVRDRLVNP
jgi:hypothetical protein